jgi:3'-phosphoadenosine 5'-phosphosulfate sulfotransferase (PAPS reductase)/FAD synthetase
MSGAIMSVEESRLAGLEMRADLQDGSRRIVWFSCGAASAVAAWWMKRNSTVFFDLVYCDTGLDEHPDNRRFLRDVERWLGYPIKIISSKKYRSVEQVFAVRRYMSGIKGAPCTVELKKVPRLEYQFADDIHIFGLTADEVKRKDEFIGNNAGMRFEWPLIDNGITKRDCLSIIENAGIKLPIMYQLGFEHNNCIGCVKATSPKYWNLVRRHFPEVFERRAKQSRDIGCKLTRVDNVRIFLDELAPDNQMEFPEDTSCGPNCSANPT